MRVKSRKKAMRDMGMANSHGQMAHTLKVIGLMERLKAEAYSKQQKEKCLRVNGRKI